MELQLIQSKIYEVRGCRVMFDFDLAVMYGIETKVLKQAVKRNLIRFPSDFMFELSESEWKNLRSQFVTSSWGGSRYQPSVFTEQGVAILSSVLKSETAVKINISIMRAFVLMCELATGYAELNQRLENFMIETNMQFNDIYQALTELAAKKEEENKPLNPIGYLANRK